MKKILVLFLVLAMLFTVAAQAETSWPKGAVTIHAAGKAGGSTDLHARFIANAWGSQINQNAVVQNYDSSAVAFEAVSNMAGDGSNVLCMHTGIIDAYLTGASDVNPLEDLKIVAIMEDFGIQAFIAGKNAPYNNFAEMLEYAKANPRKLSCAISTNNATHFMWGQIAQKYGVEFRMVECANETEKLTNVAGDFISLGNCSAANGKAYEADGKLKVLGLFVSAEDTDTSLYSEYKTLPEQGVDFYSSTYILLFAPGSTDEATLQAMNESLRGVIEDASYQEGMTNLGCAPGWHDLEESRSFLNNIYEEERNAAISLDILAEGR